VESRWLLNRSALVRRLFRSLCANTPKEDLDVIQNYRNTVIASLDLSGVEKELLDLINHFYSSSSLAGPPSITALLDIVNRDPSQANLHSYIKEVNGETPVFGTTYRSLFQLCLELIISEELSTALVTTSQITKEGRKTGVGDKAKIERGVGDALEFATIELTKLRRKLEPNQMPMGNEEAAQVTASEYIQRASNPILSYGLTLGITPIDEETRGAQNKELWMIVGAQGHGKTAFMINWVRYLITSGNYHIVYYTLEMRKQKIWDILYCSHSCNPKFGREPLSYSKIRAGMLDIDETDLYLNEIIPDIKNSPGYLQVFNPIGKTTVEDIRAQVEVANRERPVDAIFIDYMTLLGAPKNMRFGSKTERLSENVIQAKQLAMEFNNGGGITVVAASQINRAGLKKVKETNGVYEIDAIADTSEFERSSDNLYTIYQDQVLKQRREAVITNLKTRDSKLIDPFNVYAPTEYRFIGELAQVDQSQLSQLLDA
jgi:hypothetical protein